MLFFLQPSLSPWPLGTTAQLWGTVLWDSLYSSGSLGSTAQPNFRVSALGFSPQLSFSGIDSTGQFWRAVFWDLLHSSTLWYSFLGATPQLNFGEECSCGH